MSSAKKLFAPLLALGGTGAWMFMNSGNRETRRGGNFSLNLGVFMNPQGAGTKKKKIQKAKVEEPPGQTVEPKGDNDTLQPEDPGKAPEVPKEIPGSQEGLKGPEGDQLPKDLNGPKEAQELEKNLEETEERGSLQSNLKISEETVDPPQNIKEPQEVQDPKNVKRSEDMPDPNDLKRSDEGEPPNVLIEEKNLIPDPKEEISGAGLDCGKAEEETICTILPDGLNVDRGNGKKEGYVLSGTDNGRIRFRLSEERDTYSNGFRFTITGKPIKLHKKTNPSQTITLEKYENYGLIKEGDKVYLTRKLTAEKGMMKDLGLPDKCSENITSKDFDYKTIKNNTTCEIPKNQIQLINFDGKKGGGATSGGNLKLYIQKVSDETTYKGGYKFFFQSTRPLDISNSVKLAQGAWWDFRMKDPNADDLVLERVWKNDTELLNKIGLTCGADGKCTIKDNSLKIKIDRKVIEKGKKKSGDGTIYLEKNKSGYYEGLSFSVWGEKGMTIVDSNSPKTTLEMKEFEVYHITKDSKTPAFYLTKKEKAEDMIGIHLVMSPCAPNPSKPNGLKCGVNHNSLWGRFKFHDGDGEKRIKSKNSNLLINVIIYPDTKYPFGYRYSLEPEGDISIGKISLKAGSKTNFQIMRDVKNKKLYLEKVK